MGSFWHYRPGKRRSNMNIGSEKQRDHDEKVVEIEMKDVFDVCSWHARNHVVYIKQELEAPI